MYEVSDAFLARLRQNHTRTIRAEVWNAAGTTLLATLAAVGGSVTVDEGQAIRRRCSISVIDPDLTLVPVNPGDLLHPVTGNELRLYRGVKLADGTTEDVPLGVMRLSRPRIVDSSTHGRTLQIDGQDRSRIVRRNRWRDPYAVAAGTRTDSAIRAILLDRWPTMPTPNFELCSTATPAITFGIERENDPWADAMSLATVAGFELFLDVDGVPRLRPVPDPSTATSCFDYIEGADANFFDLERDLDDEETYNGVIVTGESTGATTPVRAEKWDTDPSSATYYLGSYGMAPYFYSSELISTQAQAQAVADAMFRKKCRVLEGVRFSSVVNPAHEAGDVVTMTRVDSGITGKPFVLSSFTVPLAAREPMEATTRTRAA